MLKNRKYLSIITFILLLALIVPIFNANAKTTNLIRLNNKKITLKVGGRKKLSVKLAKSVNSKAAADKVIKWKSSNKRIAKVSSSGVVKAVKAGVAKVTASCKYGKATCVVCVAKDNDNSNNDLLIKTSDNPAQNVTSKSDKKQADVFVEKELPVPTELSYQTASPYPVTNTKEPVTSEDIKNSDITTPSVAMTTPCPTAPPDPDYVPPISTPRVADPVPEIGSLEYALGLPIGYVAVLFDKEYSIYEARKVFDDAGFADARITFPYGSQIYSTMFELYFENPDNDNIAKLVVKLREYPDVKAASYGLKGKDDDDGWGPGPW